MATSFRLKIVIVLSFSFLTLFLFVVRVSNYGKSDSDFRSIASSSIINTNNNNETLHESSSSISYEPLLLWSSDFHISPIADIKNLFMSSSTPSLSNIKVIDKSLSGHCHLSNTCERNLRVINKQNGISLGNCPNRLRNEFYNSYRDDSKMLEIDAFLCLHATAMCELYMPFNTSLIVIASTRYEIGRHSKERWLEWNSNLERISQSPFNIIAANNKYDLEYIKFFTNIKNIILIPNYCGYIQERYKPTRSQVLIAPARGVSGELTRQLIHNLALFNNKNNNNNNNNNTTNFSNNKNKHNNFKESPSLSLQISHIRDLYPHFEYSDIAAHPAIVILPYQISFMSLFEFYRMQVPLFVPSPKLLTEWHLAFNVLNERTWSTVFGFPSAQSVIDRHILKHIHTEGESFTQSSPDDHSISFSSGNNESNNNNNNNNSNNSSMVMKSDPNNEMSYDAVYEWIQLADFYQWPHITQFNSWDELFTLLITSNFNSISKNMQNYNAKVKTEVTAKWNHIANQVRKGKEFKRVAYDGLILPSNLNDALSKSYGVKLNDDKCTGDMMDIFI